MKMFTAAALLGAALVAAPASAATLLQYNFAGNAGTEVSQAAVNVATGLTGLAFTRGPGLEGNTGANSLNSTGWNVGEYLTFGLNVLGGYTATVNQLTFGTQASNSGPRNFDVQANVDNGGFTLVGSFAQTSATAVSRTIDLATLTATSSIVFRFVNTDTVSANGGTVGTTGTFRVQNSGTASSAANPFSVNGDVTQAAAAVPETATWAMMIVGFGVAGAAMRRRSSVRVRFAA